MKAKIVVVSIFLIIIALLGCITSVGRLGGSYNVAENTAIADDWVKEGLYQRAIKKYKEVIEHKSSEEIYVKMFDAYEKHYLEDISILDEYIESLILAVAEYPKNVDFNKAIINYCIIDSDYESAYKYAKSAVDNIRDNDEIENLKTQVQYYVSLRTREYQNFLPCNNGIYTVKAKDKWGTIYSDGSSRDEFGYEYINSAGEDNIQIFTTSKGSTLLDNELSVLGKFSSKILDAGIFNEGLVPVKIDDKFCYVDEFAKKQFGDFEIGGSFNDGIAAVKKGGKWYFIDDKGEKISKEYFDIKVDENYSYTRDTYIVVAEKEGQYYLCDDNFEKISNVYEDMDIDYGGLIAVKENGKWGFIDADGEVVIKPTYENAKSFSNGLAAVCVDGFWGFINSDNKIVIECAYSDAYYFNGDGTCMVKTLVVETETDEEGNEVEVEYQLCRLLELKLGILEN